MSKQIVAGIVSYGLYIPDTYITAKDISDKTSGVWSEDAVKNKLGITKKAIPGKDDGTQEMAVRAAKDALKRGDVDPLSIDVILCIGEEWKEYPLTTSAMYVQGQIGADNAWGIDLQNRCCTTCCAIKIAKDMIIADDEIHTILIAGGYRNGDFIDYSDPTASMIFDLAAGAGAFIIKKNHTENTILGSHTIGDGSLARYVGIEIGGIANPITKDNIEESRRSLRLMNAEALKKRLGEVSIPNWYKCIDESLRKSGGLTRSDIDYLGILHFKKSQHDFMIQDLGLTEDQTIYLSDYGHTGQIDQILSLALGIEQGKIKDGSLVCLIAAGIGYVWSALCIKWGKQP